MSEIVFKRQSAVHTKHRSHRRLTAVVKWIKPYAL